MLEYFTFAQFLFAKKEKKQINYFAGFINSRDCVNVCFRVDPCANYCVHTVTLIVYILGKNKFQVFNISLHCCCFYTYFIVFLYQFVEDY